MRHAENPAGFEQGFRREWRLWPGHGLARPRRSAGRGPFGFALPLCLAIAASLAAPTPGFGQPAGTAAQTAPADAAKSPTLPTAFRGIKLGMGIEEVQKLLQQDPIFAYRGPEDLSLLPSKNQSLVESLGTSFVKRAFFQFIDDKLWVIVVMLNPDRLDHYSVYSDLVSKYGEPLSLDPKEARWEDKGVRMALERPLTLRYMDMKTFDKLRTEGEAAAGVDELDRRDFLGGL